jgi:hypothetical protein
MKVTPPGRVTNTYTKQKQVPPTKSFPPSTTKRAEAKPLPFFILT